MLSAVLRRPYIKELAIIGSVFSILLGLSYLVLGDRAISREVLSVKLPPPKEELHKELEEKMLESGLSRKESDQLTSLHEERNSQWYLQPSVEDYLSPYQHREDNSFELREELERRGLTEEEIKRFADLISDDYKKKWKIESLVKEK